MYHYYNYLFELHLAIISKGPFLTVCYDADLHLYYDSC